jgi:hypothetical protein
MNTFFIEKIIPTLLSITIIFAFIGLIYSNEKFKINLKNTFTKIHYYILPYLIMFSLFFIVNLISKFLFKIITYIFP